MENFQIIYPSPELKPFIRHYWILKSKCQEPLNERIIPCAEVNLVFHRADRMYSSSGMGLQPRCFMSGILSSYTDLSNFGTINMIVVVFYPHTTSFFIDSPISEFQNKCISIDEIDKDFKELQYKILDTEDDIQCIQFIEEFLKSRFIYSFSHQHKRLITAIKILNNYPQVKISSLAQEACLSPKQFNRVFANAIGTTPKEFSRIIRFQRSLHILQHQKSISLTELALECDYYDQSHFIKEFKEFSGYTPTEFLNICDPYSDYFS